MSYNMISVKANEDRHEYRRPTGGREPQVKNRWYRMLVILLSIQREYSAKLFFLYCTYFVRQR